MSALVYDGLTGAAVGLIGIGVFLVSLAVLDMTSWLMARLLAAVSSSAGRAMRVRSALAAVDERRK
jgi:hypothetical protein